MQIKILVIDDEEPICEILKYNLEKEGYEVDCAYSAEEALEKNIESYSLFIVDIMMEKQSGFDFAKKIRNNFATEHTPIIFCSALLDEDDKVMGLNIGADDYITKPFVVNEVLARVRAVLRRAHLSQPYAPNMAYRPAPMLQEPSQSRQPKSEPDVVFKGLRLSNTEKSCYVDDQEIGLTRTEYDILKFFLTHRNKIYSRENIIKSVWGDDQVVTGRTIDTNITRMRKKLGPYAVNLVTKLGFGYGFKENND